MAIKGYERIGKTRKEEKRQGRGASDEEGDRRSDGIPGDRGTTKEVRQVYRSPSQAEKGKEYDGDDVRPEEMSDVELHVVMEQLFREGSTPITLGNSIPQS